MVASNLMYSNIGIFSDSLNRSTIEMKYYGKCINYEKNAYVQNNDYYIL